ncbi:MAG: glycosyl hydrolase family 18 protein [Terriglobia bacterium]
MRRWRCGLLAVSLAAALAALFSFAPAPGRAADVSVSFPAFTGSFTVAGKQYRYTIAGRNPERGGTTTIPVVLVPMTFAFEAGAGNTRAMDAAPDAPKIIASPIFQKYAFPGGTTQYGDAVQRAEFYQQAVHKNWHTLLGKPRITPPLRIEIPAADGYILHSKRTGQSFAVVDVEYAKGELFKALPKIHVRPNELVMAVARNTDFYPLNDATVCCSWGAHGVQVDSASGAAQPYILSTYLDPGVVPRFSDVQALSQQLVEWMNDPLQGYQSNVFPPWRSPGRSFGCGRGMGTMYRFAEPTDAASISNAAAVMLGGTEYHLENVALLPWFAENQHPDSFQGVYSFPDTHALAAPAQPCFRFRGPRAPFTPTASPIAENHHSRHQLIGYWVGYNRSFPLRDVSPQWDVVIVAFAPPAKGSTSVMEFHTPGGYTKAQFKSDIDYLQQHGKEVLISLGGGGRVVALNTAKDLADFTRSVGSIVKDYGFNGIDLDFETPSIILNPGDSDFRHPTTPAVVNLIGAVHQLRRRFGPRFMLAEVPEGPQVPAGLVSYAGQFGSFLPVIYGTRKILSFVDVQDYNTPPLEGLDGNYYMPDTADYYVSMTEPLLHGFAVGGNQNSIFPALPAYKVAVGFLAGRSPLPAITKAVRYLVDGTTLAGGEYVLQRRGGYPDFDGAMLWTIQADRRENYDFSNTVGPLLHRLPNMRRER